MSAKILIIFGVLALIVQSALDWKNVEAKII